MRWAKQLLPWMLIPLALVAANNFVGDITVTGGALSFGTGGVFRPPFGTTLPATCTVGDVFFDSDATAGQNLYACTATNTWTLMGGSGGGESIIDARFGQGLANAGWNSNAIGMEACRPDSTVSINSGATNDWGQGALVVNQLSNEGAVCFGRQLTASDNLDSISFAVYATEYQNNTGHWDFDLGYVCYTSGDSPSLLVATDVTYPGASARVVLTGNSSTTIHLLMGTVTGIDVSASCAVGDIMAVRVQVGDTSTSGTASSGDISWRGFRVY